MKKLILVDGSSILSSNYYGSLPWDAKKAKTPEDRAEAMKKAMQTKDGQFTNGVYGMTKFLLKVIKEQKPTHMIIAWDISRDTFRREIYPAYKGTRGDTPAELKSQFILAQNTLEFIGLKQYMLSTHEADDIVGTFAKKFESEVPTYIITGDQDALQLITDYTKVWLKTDRHKDLYAKRNVNISELNIPDKTFEFTPHTFEEEYGIKPIQIIDMKSLEGDKSDNIPGVRGVGPKAVLPLLQEYGTIENIYDAIEGLSPEEEIDMKLFLKELGISRSPLANLLKVAEGEIVGKEAAFLSKKLATIVTDIPEYSNVNLDDIVIQLDEQKMKQKFAELEFKSFL